MIKRGDIYCCQLYGVGSVQKDYRPCLVVSNDLANKYGPIITILPITSKRKKTLPTHVPIALEVESYIMAEQVVTVDKSQIGKFITRADCETMLMVEAAMHVQFNMGEDEKFNRYLLNTMNEYRTLLTNLKREINEEKEKVKILIGGTTNSR